MNLGNGQTILEEDYDETYEPTEKEILDYCKVIGLDPYAEKDLLYIAKEGTKALLPPDWKAVEDKKTGRIYYFNFRTGERTWDHPCDEIYLKMLTEERRKRNRVAGGPKKGSKKAAKKSVAAGSEVSAQLATVNPLISTGGLGEGRGSVGPLAPHRGLPPLRVPSLKSGGGLAPVRPPPGMPLATVGVPATGPHSMHPPSIPSSQPLHTRPHPSTSITAHLPVEPLQRGRMEGDGGKNETNAVRGIHEHRLQGNDVGPRGGGGGKEMGGRGGFGGHKHGNPLGTVELGPNLNITTHFEEEGEEEGDSSSGISGGFESKLGEKLISSNDIGFKSEEELNSSEDVSEELMKLLHSGGEEGESEEGEEGGEEEEMERPVAPLGQRQHTGYSPIGPNIMPSSPLLSPPIPSSLSPLPATQGGMYRRAILSQPPPTTANDETTYDGEPAVITTANSRGLPTATTAKIRGLPITSVVNSSTMGMVTTVNRGGLPDTSIISAANSRVLPTTTGSSITPPPGIKANITSTATPAVSDKDTNQVPSQIVQQSSTTTSLGGFSVAEIKLGGRGQVGVASEEEVEIVKREGREEVERVKKEGREEVERVKREGREEVERVRREGREEVERVRREGKEELERVKRELEEERAEEERKLRDMKLKNMSALKKMLKEEEEEEEARLVEEKEDALRRLRQKVSAEREREEAKLREEAAKARQQLVEQLASEKCEEEARLRLAASQELSEFRAEHESETEREREEARRELQRQLKVFREEQEEKHNKEKAEIEESLREQLEALQREQQQKSQQLTAEEEREKAMQAHQLAISTLTQEFAGALESKRSELQEQHCTALETLQKGLESTLTSLKTEHERKVEEEKQRLKTEYEAITTTMKQEQEGRMEQLRAELALSEEQYRQKVQIQTEKLAELQAHYDTKHRELEQLQQDLEQQTRELEKERPMVEEDRTKLKTLTGRGRENTRDNPLLLVAAEVTCIPTPAHESLSPSLPGPHEQSPSARRARMSGSERVKAETPDGGEGVTIKSHDLINEDDWSETSGTVGSMQLEELAPPTSDANAHTDTQNTADNLESIRTMLEQNQRTLLRVLAEEQSRSKALQRSLEMRGEGGRGRRRGRTVEEKESGRRVKRMSTQPPRLVESGAFAFPSNTVKSKLKEEARALGELEEKLRSSRQVLSSKEQDLRELNSFLTQELSSDDERNSERAAEQTREKSSQKTGRGSTGRVTISDREGFRTPRQASRTSSIIRTSRSRDEETDFRTGLSSSRTQRASLPNALHSTPSSAVGGRGRRERKPRLGVTSDRGCGTGEPSRVLRLEMSESSSGGGVAVVESSESEGSTTDGTSTIEDEQVKGHYGIAKSLKMINSQLSQLMSQFDQGPPHHYNPSATVPMDMATHCTYPSMEPLSHPTLLPSTRWAERVRHPMFPASGHHTPQPRHRRRREFTNPRHVHTDPGLQQPFRSSDGHVTSGHTPQDRSAEMLRYQTDWLQEFHHRFPGRPVPLPLAPLVPSPSVPHAPYSVPHAQLVMDGDKNIHFVHV